MDKLKFNLAEGILNVGRILGQAEGRPFGYKSDTAGKNKYYPHYGAKQERKDKERYEKEIAKANASPSTYYADMRLLTDNKGNPSETNQGADNNSGGHNETSGAPSSN